MCHFTYPERCSILLPPDPPFCSQANATGSFGSRLLAHRHATAAGLDDSFFGRTTAMGNVRFWTSRACNLARRDVPAGSVCALFSLVCFQPLFVGFGTQPRGTGEQKKAEGGL